MSTLLDYYNDLLRWENIPVRQLVMQWSRSESVTIERDFRQAIHGSLTIGGFVPIVQGSTNQSIGNQVERHFIREIHTHLSEFKIFECSGAGYPDKALVRLNDRKEFPLEFKATSHWNPSDSNRRVLTSSSTKLRRKFRGSINHILATVIYNNSGGTCRVEQLRLDFLEPDTQVNVRLEASVNHKILSQGSHHNVTL